MDSAARLRKTPLQRIPLEASHGALEKGITANGTGYGGKTWNILGQVYFPKAVSRIDLRVRDQ